MESESRVDEIEVRYAGLRASALRSHTHHSGARVYNHAFDFGRAYTHLNSIPRFAEWRGGAIPIVRFRSTSDAATVKEGNPDLRPLREG